MARFPFFFGVGEGPGGSGNPFFIPRNRFFIIKSNFESQRIEKAKAEYENQKMLKEIEESKKRQAVQQQKREQWNNMNLLERMAAEPLSQDQILQNRKRYGMS